MLGLLAFLLATCSMLAVQARHDADRLPGTPLLVDALGAPKPNAPLTTQPVHGVRVKIDRSGFEVVAPKRTVALRALGAGARRWARYSRGVSRSTRFGHETIVVTPEKAEHFLTVDERQGIKTWQWRLDAAGLAPRVGADGAVAFLAAHKLAGVHVEPVAILDEQGRDLTPKSLRWSVARDGAGWLLQLRFDDRTLPLPYVIDPAVSYRLAQVSDNGAAGGTSIVLNLPAGVVQNDLLFAHVSARGGANMTISTPTGWTLLRNVNSSNVVRLATFYRIATSSEPASYTFDFGGTTPSQQAVGAITAYYGVKANTAPGPLDVNGATNTGNSATPSANSITAAASSVVIAAYSHGTGNGTTGSAMFTTATGMNERYDAQSQDATAGNRSSIAADDILSAAGGATGAKAVTAGASARWVAHQVSFNVDNVSPSTTTTFPTASGSYNIAGWNAGCSPSGICGTASDGDSSVQKVEVSIRQGSGNYWNGSSFSSASEVWNLAGGTTSWNYGFGASSFPVEGSYTIQVQVTDTAGNVSAPAGATFTADTTAPALPTSLASTPTGPANNNSPAVSGTAEAGSTVNIYATAACTGAPAATGTGAAFGSPGITVSVSDDTSTTFKATATDAAGNVSGCSTSSVTYLEDSAAPALPASLASNPVSPANNNSPAISGTAEAGSTINIYTTGACTGAPAASGTAAAFASPGLTATVSDDGSTTFKATATDAAGNVSGCSSSSVTYVEDSTTPSLPASLASNPVSPANNNSPAISGTVEAGSTVKLYTTAACTGAPNATGTAAAFASPGIAASVADGSTTTFKATATDAAGNVSGCSTSSVTYVEDSTAPALPASLTSTPVSPANNNSPKIAGTAEAGSTVKLYTTTDCSGSVAASGTAAAFASTGLTVAVSDDGSTTFKATATDGAGNVSGCSAGLTYVEDSAVPALPVSLASTPASPANDNSPKISGTAETGSTVKLYTTSDCSGALAASGTAAAFSGPGLAVAVSDDSTTTFKATATDAAGNVSVCSASSVTYVEDSAAPASPSSLGSTPTSPANDNAPRISGSAAAGSTVSLYTTSDCSGSVAASGTAAAFASPGLTVAVSDDSSTTFRATATDAAGNVSGCSATSVTYIEDSTAPALPTLLASTPVSPADDNNPKISGSAEAGSTVELYATSGCSGAVAASGTAAGFASPGLTVAVADDSSTTFKAIATDAAGNVSACSASSVTYVEDSSAPVAPSSLNSSPVSPANDNAPRITGNAEAGSTVKLYTTSDCSGSVAASGSAAAFSSPGLTVAVGDASTTTFRATATDAAGNVSGCSAGLTYIEDSTDPPEANGFGSTPVSPADDNAPKIYGNAEAGSTVKLYTTSDCSGSVAASGSAAAFSSPGLTVAVGDDSTTTFRATATDAAGNVSVCSSASYVYVEDSSSPSSAVTFPASGGTYSPGAWNAGCASTGFCGTASDGSGSGLQTIELSIRQGVGSYYDGSSFSSGSEIYLTASGTSSWNYGFSDARFPVDGPYTIRVRSTDNAGNVESFSSRTFVFDSSAPTVPSLSFSSFTNASATGQTVYFRPGVGGGFRVTASSSDPQSGISSYGFPALGGGWSGSQADADYDYTFSAGAGDPAEPNDVTAQNSAGLSSSTSFSVTPDSTAPLTSIACDGSPCAAGWHTSSVSVSLSAEDGTGSGSQEIRYTTDGSDPGPFNGATYAAPFSFAATTTVRFRAYDAVGNEEAVGSQLVRIDDSAPTAPTLTLTEEPASAFEHVVGTTLFYNPQSNYGGSFPVDAITSDSQSGIDQVSFPALAGMTGGGNDSSSPYEGSYSWTAASNASGWGGVTAQNNAGLANGSGFTVTPDTAAPSGGSVGYPDGYAGSSVTIATDDGTDGLSGVNGSTGVIERDATNLVNGVCDPFPGSWSAVTSPDSTIASGQCYRYRYRVSDNVSNNAVYTSGNVVKVSSSAPATPDLTLAETPSSPNQYVDNTTVFYNPTGGNSGTFTVAAGVTDSGGSGIDRMSFPSLAGIIGGGDDTTSPYQASYDWGPGSGATGPQTVTVHNNAGLTSSASFTVTPDTSPPTGQAADLTAGYYTTLSVPVSLQNGSDALAGIDPASAVLEREVATLANGSCVAWTGAWSTVSLAGGADTTVQSNRCYRYRYSISDNVGNQSAPSAASADAKVDATAPVTGDDAPTGWQNAAVTVMLDVAETGSGVASTQYRLDGGSFQSGTSIIVPAPGDHSNDGVHTLEYRSTDNAGNGETLRSATVRIDTTLPTTTDDAPGGWSTSAVTVTLSPADALSGIASTQYGVDGGSFQSGTSIVVPAPADHSNDGVHTLQYGSADNAGNAEPLQTATVRIDTELPSGALSAPADGAHVNGHVAVSASASDAPSGVTSVEFLVRSNGSGSFNTISTDTTAPYDADWDSTGEPEGDTELKVVVVDGAGQPFTSAIRTVVVDNPPTPTLGEPGANLRGTVTLEAASQPDTAQVVFQRSPAGAGTWTPIATDPSAPFSADFDSTAVGDGNFDFRAVATDLGGFSGTSPLQTARIDNTAPSVAVSEPADGAIVNGPNVHVAAPASDLGSGVASVRFEQRPADSGSFTAIGTDVSAPYEASWDTTSLSGSYELRAVATDAAGNPGTAATITVTVDATAPSVGLHDPGSLLRGVVNLSASAPNPAIASVAFERRPAGGSSWTRISLDTSRPWSAAFDTETIGDGLYDLRAQALNGSGGVLATHMRERIRIDNTAPALESAIPGDGSVLTSVTSIVLAASEPVAEVRGALLDGTAATGEISGSNVSFSTGELGAGEHALTGTFVDAAGNTGAFALHFTIRVEAKATFIVQVGKPETRSRGKQRLFLVPLNLSAPATVRATLLGPTGRKLRAIKERLRAGRHSLRFVLPTDSVPPGRYMIVVGATSADGTRISKRVTVTVPAASKRAVKKEQVHETVVSIDETAPAAPQGVAGPAPAPKPAPKSMPSSRKPKPKPHVLTPVRKPLETARTYARSKEGRNIVLGLLLLTLGGGLAVLIKLEIGRLLSSTRRLGG